MNDPYRSPLVPWQSRFPIGSGIAPDTQAVPSGPATRPLGLWHAVPARPIELGKHDKKPTKTTRVVTTPTGDGNGVPPTPDSVTVPAHD